MSEPCPVYVFRAEGPPSSGAMLSVAPMNRIVEVYGGGGNAGEAGLSAAFGGCAVFKNGISGECFAGVWGARNASLFRSQLRAQTPIVIRKEAPDAQLVFWKTADERPKGLPGASKRAKKA